MNQLKIKPLFVSFSFFLSIVDVLLDCVTRQNNHNLFLYLNVLALAPSQKHTPVRQTYTHLLHEAQMTAAAQPHEAHFVEGSEKELQL